MVDLSSAPYHNCMRDHLRVVQVGDLGLARVLPSSAILESKTSSLIGPVQWMSPEAHRGEYSRASDVFMFGATLFELLTLKPPLAGTLNHESVCSRCRWRWVWVWWRCRLAACAGGRKGSGRREVATASYVSIGAVGAD